MSSYKTNSAQRITFRPSILSFVRKDERNRPHLAAIYFCLEKKNIKIQFRCCKCFNKSSVTVSDKNQSQHEVYVYIHTHSIFITPDDCTIKTQDKYCFKKGCEENLSFCRNYGIFLYFKTRALYIQQVFLSAMVGSLANMQRNAAVSHISCQKN